MKTGKDSKGRFTEGNPGKPDGAKNKVTQSMRQAWMDAFEGVGGVKALIKWGKDKKNRAAFYSLASKLIPIEMTGPNGTPLIPPPIYMASDAPAK